jgi:transposase-like protein
MQKRIVRKDEQLKLIMECRQSGLSDYQWCQKQGINAGTFYNWVSKLRKSGYTIPDSNSKSEGAAVVQDVVKADLVSEDISSPVIEQNTRPLTLNTKPAVAAELVAGNVTLRFFNGADQNLIRCAMQCLGGVSRAW